jgi:hypothetical protein
MADSLTTSSSNITGSSNVSSAAATLPGLDLRQTTSNGVNPLDKFQTFNSLFTLAAITKEQQNMGKIEKGKLDYVICRSQGDWGNSKHVGTDFGSFDYFIDDLIITSIPAPHPIIGLTTATKITFKVTEPYSMGLFMLTLQQGAYQAGYKLNFKEAAYVLMIEFKGYVDGNPSAGEPDADLTRYIPIKIQNITFKVTASGTVYEVSAIPYNEIALRDHVSKTVTDVRLSGNTVKDLLVDGDESLLAQLQTKYTHNQQDGIINRGNADNYTIYFPRDFTELTGSQNIISNSKVDYSFNNNGVQPFQDLDKDSVHDKKGDIYKKGIFKMENNRVWHFVQECTIPDIITEVVIRSDYITNQLVGEKFTTDSMGMINWFRIETRIEDWADNPALGRQERSIVYRVLPYKVHISRFLPPGQKPPGYETLRKSVHRTYNYIYTGQNTEILDLKLEFDLAYFTPVPFDGSERVGQNNKGTSGMFAGGKERQFVFPETGQSAGNPGSGGDFSYQSPSPIVQMQNSTSSSNESLISVIGQGATSTSKSTLNLNDIKSSRPEIQSTSHPVANRDFFAKAPGGAGADNAATSQVRSLQHMLTNPGDMINLDMEIMGDPYYLPTSGMGSLVRKPISNNLLEDGSMNYQSGEVDIIVNFRTPIDLDPSTGLYRFEKGIDMWSGLYMVREVESKFNGGKFTQNIKGIRRRAQYGDSLGSEQNKSIFLKETAPKQEDPNASDGGGYGSGGAGAGSSSGGGGYGGGSGGETAPTFTEPATNYGSGANQAGIPQTPSSDIMFRSF